MSDTVKRARELADQWKAQREWQESQPNEHCYAKATPHELIQMWDTGKNLDGTPQSQHEFGCLVESWADTFGFLLGETVPCEKKRGSLTDEPGQQTAMAPAEPMPADDTMLRMPDVERMTAVHMSTIKRMIARGEFPKPLPIGVRAKGWPARQIKAWLRARGAEQN